jgi:DNA-3-methyladenine glycosylase I
VGLFAIGVVCLSARVLYSACSHASRSQLVTWSSMSDTERHFPPVNPLYSAEQGYLDSVASIPRRTVMNEPMRFSISQLSDYLEAMSRAVFGSGMSWKVIDSKWSGIHESFDGFDPDRVAAYTPDDVERLMADTRVVRNRKKIEAIVANAGEMIVTDREFGGFARYLESFADNEALVKDLHARFKFLGESVAHVFLYSIGFNAEEQARWAREHFGRAAHSAGAGDKGADRG